MTHSFYDNIVMAKAKRWLDETLFQIQGGISPFSLNPREAMIRKLSSETRMNTTCHRSESPCPVLFDKHSFACAM